MAATFVSALVIKHNGSVFMNTDNLSVGKIMPIPTPGAGAELGGDYWAVPINDNVVSGFNYIPAAPTDTVPPTPQSFHVFKLASMNGNETWVVRGTTTGVNADSPATYGYIQVAADAECCSATPRQLPTDVPVIAPCQTLCNWDADSKYFGKFGLPVLTGNLRYYPSGYYNGALLTGASSSGYTTKTNLLSFLNGSWSAIGTWTEDATGNGITVTQSAGDGTDTVCISVITLDPSA